MASLLSSQQDEVLQTARAHALRHKPRWTQTTYEQFAAILGEYAHDEFSRDDLIRGFSDLFACDNPRFNPDLFRDRVIQGWMSRGGNT